MPDYDLQTIDGKPRRNLLKPRVTYPGENPRIPILSSPGTPPLIPEKDWPDYKVDIEPLIWHIVDQWIQGSCAGAAGVGGMMAQREAQGLDKIVLSQAVPYALCNGGRDAGASIDCILKTLMEVGTVPIDVIDQYDWQGYYRGRWPDGWEQEAAPYRLREGWDCPTYEHLVSAVKRGYFVEFGVWWSGGGGHAIVAYDGDSDGVDILNSWSPDWGDGGKGRLPRSQATEGIRYFGAFAFRYAVDPTGEADLPPIG